MFYAPSEQDIADAQAHVVVLSRRRDLCAKRETLRAQLAEVENELRNLPTGVNPAYRRPGMFERAHRRMGLA